MAASTLQQALDALLGDETLEEMVLRLRSEGRSWRAIAFDVYDRTGVRVTHESLRTWFGPEPVGLAS